MCRWRQGLRQALFSLGIDAAWNDNNEYELWDEEAVCHGGHLETPKGLAVDR
jgi:alpha-glucosidase